MINRFKQTGFTVLLVVLACMSTASVMYVSAITAPTAPPSSTTTPLPLHTGSAAQTKSGALTVSGAVAANGGLTVSGGSGLCLGGVCKTAWPSSTVQAATAGVSGALNTYCYSNNYNPYYGNYYYYQYNYEYSYSNGGYYYCDLPFSITTAVVPGVPIGALSYDVKCYMTDYNYYYTPASPGYYSSYYSRPSSVSVSFNGSNQAVISGACSLFDPYYNYAYQNKYTHIDATATVRYLY